MRDKNEAQLKNHQGVVRSETPLGFELAPTFGFLARSFLHGWKLVLVSTLTFFVFGLVLATVIPDRYEASSLVVFDDLAPSLADPEGDPELLIDDVFLEGQVELMGSEEIARRLAEEGNWPADLETLLSTGPFGGLSTSSQSQENELRYRLLRSSYDIERLGRTGVLRVTANSRDAELAAEIANGVVKAYINRSVEDASEIARDALSTIQIRSVQIQQQIAELEEQLNRSSQSEAQGIELEVNSPLLSRLELLKRYHDALVRRELSIEQRVEYPLLGLRQYSEAKPPLKASGLGAVGLVAISLSIGFLVGVFLIAIAIMFKLEQPSVSN